MDRASKAAFASVFVGALVLALKFVAYWLTGSIALYSDALESIINVVAAGAAFIALRVSAQPADAIIPTATPRPSIFPRCSKVCSWSWPPLPMPRTRQSPTSPPQRSAGSHGKPVTRLEARRLRKMLPARKAIQKPR